jgi:TolB-like protein/class 3 adenylate cyclase/Flp pilus assembly protein TadD
MENTGDKQIENQVDQSHRLAAIMFTDIVGYTASMNDNEDKAYALLEKNREIQKPLIAKFNGIWIKEIGDGILSSFTSISEAVNCAREIMNSVFNDPDLDLRIGIHQGEVLLRDGDIFGNEVNIASRIQALAPPGKIWISEPVYRNITNRKDIETQPVGEKDLRNVKEPVKLFEVVMAGSVSTEIETKKMVSRKWVMIILGIMIISVTGYFSYQNLSTVVNPMGTQVELDKSIAVLPFKNLSSDQGNQYFADGVMNGILNHLSTLEDLRVVSRSSTERYRSNIPPVKEIAMELNVSYLLEASIFKSDDKIRVTSQLIDARNDTQVWSSQYDRELVDLFEVMSEISQKVAGEIKAIISPSVKERMESIPTQNIDAYNLYLQGRHFWLQEGKVNLDRSIEYYQKALDLDSSFALAYVGMAVTYNSYAWFGYSPRRAVLPRAKLYARKALELDDSLGEAHTELAFVYLQNDWDWIESEKEFKRALALNPNNARTHNLYAWLLTDIGRHDEAIMHGKKAHQLDPLTVDIWVELGRRYYWSGDYDRAIDEYKKIIDVFPSQNYSPIYWYPRSELAKAYAMKGMYQKAIEEYEKIQFEPTFHWHLGYIYGLAGEKEKAMEILDQYLRLYRSEFVWSAGIGIIYIGLGENDKAFEWLEKTFKQKEGWMTELKVEPMFDPIRSDPRFQDLLARMNFPD